MLTDTITMREEFVGLDTDISLTISADIKKYRKYYDFMDTQDTYYIALILDPRFKTLLLEKKLDETAASIVIASIKELLHTQYPLQMEQQSSASEEQQAVKKQNIETRILQKLQPQKKKRSDIDRYFKDSIVTIHKTITKEENWLFS